MVVDRIYATNFFDSIGMLKVNDPPQQGGSCEVSGGNDGILGELRVSKTQA